MNTNLMIHRTKEQNRATVTYCAQRKWCSMPNYARQDAELSEIAKFNAAPIDRYGNKIGEAHRHNYNALGRCACGMRNFVAPN